MTGTERLYYADSLLCDFRARVVEHGTFGGAATVVLDRTAFYPESGGQMADRGRIGETSVVDVQVDDTGVVHHRLDGPLPAVGNDVSCGVDRARRRVHMALHTGQHMLSRALEDEAGAATVSSRLGETACTIDVDRDVLDEGRVARAENLVNAVIDDDLAVRAFFPDPGELAALPLRRRPKVTDNIRIVAVGLVGDGSAAQPGGAFDVTPCGGTHCVRTAQVGFVRVSAIERYKGKARVTFSAGPRARGELFGESGVLRSLGKQFTCGPDNVPDAVEKLRRELDAARHALGRARGRVAEAVAAELLASSTTAIFVAVLDDTPIEVLRTIASRVTSQRADAVVVLGGRMEAGMAVLAARGERAAVDCGAVLKRAATAAGGRGGGRAEHAEGRVPRDADWEALVSQALSA